MVSAEEYAHALAKMLDAWNAPRMRRKAVLALLREHGLSDGEAEAVIASGVALGILGDDGSEVRAM